LKANAKHKFIFANKGGNLRSIKYNSLDYENVPAPPKDASIKVLELKKNPFGYQSILEQKHQTNFESLNFQTSPQKRVYISKLQMYQDTKIDTLASHPLLRRMDDTPQIMTD
jgi:hypothetical protein